MSVDASMVQEIAKQFIWDLRALGLEVDEAVIKDSRVVVYGEDVRKADQATHFEKMAELATENDMRVEYRTRAKRLRDELGQSG